MMWFSVGVTCVSVAITAFATWQIHQARKIMRELRERDESVAAVPQTFSLPVHGHAAMAFRVLPARPITIPPHGQAQTALEMSPANGLPTGHGYCIVYDSTGREVDRVPVQVVAMEVGPENHGTVH